MIKVTIVGVGLIGGSFGLVMRNKGITDDITGVDNNEEHCSISIIKRIVDKIATLKEGLKNSDLVILAMPVNGILKVLPEVLDIIDERTVVMDSGSTKASILDIIKNHPKRGRFVATHPMWGTEFSGPEAAKEDAFANKATIICNKEESDDDALELVKDLYSKLGMHLIFMNGKEHDIHVAYVSHISHITSFALANTVLEKEKEEDAIFELASAGFESTVRLANSNPTTWASIFMENRENVLDVLNEHISQLRKFKSSLEKENYSYLEELMINANKINRILK